MENKEKVRKIMKNQGKVMDNDEKVRKIMKNQRKILENEEKVRKNEGKPMKHEGKVMENKEKVRKPCQKKKTRKKNKKKTAPYIYIYTGWWFQTCFYFSIQLGMSSSQLTKKNIFQRGRAPPPTSTTSPWNMGISSVGYYPDNLR